MTEDSPSTSDRISLFIVPEGDIDSQATFLRSFNLSVSKTSGPMNAAVDLIELMRNSPQYLLVSGSVYLIATAIKEYGKSKQKHIRIKNVSTGDVIEASNYSVDELNQLDLAKITLAAPRKKKSEKQG